MPVQCAASDELLIQKFKNGNTEAFDTLYQRHLPSVYNRVRYIVPEADVEDVTQEVFIAAIKSIRSFRGESRFSTWLRTLTNHKVAEYYRKRNRKQEAPQVPLSEIVSRGEDNPARWMDEQLALRHALNQLSEAHREVILLRFAEGLQFNEIADLTGRNLDSTKSLFRRAMSALRNQLDESK